MKNKIISLIISVSLLICGCGSTDSSDIPEQEYVYVSVNTENIINEDFLGLGANVLPTLMMPESIAAGYNAAYFELDKARITAVNPKLVRVWFQIDWFEESKGVYNFESENMKAFCMYMDFLKSKAIEVEFNFGWKAGSKIWDWYGIDGVDKLTSAPADINAYAASCSAALDFLLNEKSYDNIKYLTFYNEPNGDWDFETASSSETDQQKYYLDMARAVSERLKADNLRERIEIWGPEESGAPEWLDYMYENGGDVFDVYTCHEYGVPYESIINDFPDWRKRVGGKSLGLTEFGWNSAADTSFASDYTGTLIAAANSGLNCALLWILNGARLVDPGNYAVNDHALWDFLPSSGGKLNEAFYVYGMLMRAVPAHSKVLETETSANGVRSAVFEDKNGDLTVVLQTERKFDGKLKIEFDDKTGRKFYKYSYGGLAEANGLAMLPECRKSLNAEGILYDEDFSGRNRTVIYTTVNPKGQVVTSPSVGEVKAEEKITVTGFSTSDNKELVWSVLTGGGSIDKAGVYHADGTKPGECIAVKAALKDAPDIYSVTVINIK